MPKKPQFNKEVGDDNQCSNGVDRVEIQGPPPCHNSYISPGNEILYLKYICTLFLQAKVTH
jgi:hypothetical protein